MSDHYKDLVGFTFSSQQLIETFRVHINDGFMRTPPMILPDGHSLIGVQGSTQGDLGAEVPASGGRIVFAGPNGNKIAPVALDSATQAAPTRMADGRVAVVDAPMNATRTTSEALARATLGPMNPRSLNVASPSTSAPDSA
ncbi:MAG: hypothetical protein HC869_16935 [Rhodospirillales bacterium]|nr:hypothetical protein [Rhodospirillales bacterium]